MTKYQAIIYRQESQICHLTFPWIHDGLRLSWKYGQDGLYMIPSIVTNPPLNSQHSTFGRGLKCVLNFCGPSTAINSHQQPSSIGWSWSASHPLFLMASICQGHRKWWITKKTHTTYINWYWVPSRTKQVKLGPIWIFTEYSPTS